MQLDVDKIAEFLWGDLVQYYAAANQRERNIHDEGPPEFISDILSRARKYKLPGPFESVSYHSDSTWNLWGRLPIVLMTVIVEDRGLLLARPLNGAPLPHHYRAFLDSEARFGDSFFSPLTNLEDQLSLYQYRCTPTSWRLERQDGPVDGGTTTFRTQGLVATGVARVGSG